MRAISHAARRSAIAVSSLSVFGIAVMAAAAPAAATPSSQPVPVPITSPVGSPPSAPAVPAFSSCTYGEPAHTPLVVVANARGQRWGFEATGPYRFAPRDITGPLARLVNYSNCRVWLHESGNPSAAGPSKCFSPYRFHSSAAIARAWEHAGSIVVTGNTARCP
jgi:hypothetical protein